MADYTLSAKLTADSRGFSTAFDQAKEKMQGLSDNVKGFGTRLKDTGKNMAMTGAKITAMSAPIMMIGRNVMQTGMEFESSMSKVQAISGATGSDLESLEGIAKEMGSTTVFSASEAAQGLEYMALAGWETHEMTAALPGVLDLATAGALDLGRASDIVTDMMSVFSMEATDAGKASDIFAFAQANANTNVDQLGEALGKAGPAAAAAGMDLEQTSAILGIFADNGVKGSRAGTTLEAMLRDVRTSAEDGAIAIGDASVAVYDAEGSMRSMADIMTDVESATVGMTGAQRDEAMASVFQQQAMSGVNIVLGEGTDKLHELEAGLYGSEGAAGDMAHTMSDNLQGSIASLGSATEGLYLSFYDLAGGPMRDIVDRLTGMIRSFTEMDDKTRQIIAIAALLAVALGPVIAFLGLMTMGVGGLATAFAFLISPVGLVIAGIVGLGVAFGVAMARSEAFRTIVMNGLSTVKNIVMDVVDTIRPILENMFTAGLTGANEFADGLGGKLLGAFETIQSVVMDVVGVVGQFVSSIVEGFKSAGGEASTLSTLFLAFNPVLKIALMVLTQFGPEIAAGFSEIASMAMPILNLLGETLGQLAAAVIPMVMNVVATLIPIIIMLGTTIMEIVMSVLPILLELFMQIVPVVMSLVTTVIGLVSQLLPLVAVIISSLVPVLMMLVDVILNIVQAVAPALIAIIGAVIAILQAIIPVVVMILSTVINVMAGIIAAITPIIAFVAGIITNIIAIIAPIVTFIAGIIASIFNVITPIVVFVTGIFNSVFSVVSGVFQNIMQFIASAIQTVSNTISSLSGTVSGVFNSIWSSVSTIMTRVSSRIQAVFSAITTSWTGLRTFVSSVFTGIGDNMQTLVNRVKGFVNGVIGNINSAIGLINKIPGVSIGKIPMLARGTEDFEGGFARINEGGRGELVHMPGGSQVIPHDVSMRYAREAGKASSDGGSSQGNRDNVNVEGVLRGIGPVSLEIPINGRTLAKQTYEDMWEFIQRDEDTKKRFS
ncbi:phage tail tape measure protein [Salipaludibacillus sp. HK11]|uniref:phage tail tape measure protein n=1 Tax=Salipaludibacillus sp. HK11 TaxID=3394320 RepID=UPI0039FB9924